MIPLAIRTIQNLLENPETKDSVKADVAFQIVNRVLGKPVEKQEVSVNLLAQVLDKIKDVTPRQAQIEIPRDKFDDFIDNNVKPFQVGARSEQVERPVENSNSEATANTVSAYDSKN
jgi:hypothetical protein